jgi:hypothetical protein
MVDRGDPFGLLGYDCRQLKLEKVSQGVLPGPVLDPCSHRVLSRDAMVMRSQSLVKALFIFPSSVLFAFRVPERWR